MRTNREIEKKIKELESLDHSQTRLAAIKALKWVLSGDKEINIPFEKIWDIYSPTNRSIKKKAREYWASMSNVKREKAVEGAQSFLDYSPFDGYPHPSLYQYLKQERWTDQPGSVVTKTVENVKSLW